MDENPAYLEAILDKGAPKSGKKSFLEQLDEERLSITLASELSEDRTR